MNTFLNFISNYKPTFLTSGSINQAAQSLGISSNDGNAIGNHLVNSIVSLMQKGGLILALICLAVVAFVLMSSRKQEQRTEAMTRILYIAGGILIVSLLVGIVGYLVGLAQ